MVVCVCLSDGIQVNTVNSASSKLTSYTFDGKQLRRCNDLSQSKQVQ